MRLEEAFTGGVARNGAMVEMLEGHLGMPLRVCGHPEVTGAVGAALHAEAMDTIKVEQGGGHGL